MPVVVSAAAKTDGPFERAKLAVQRLWRRGAVRGADAGERTRGASRLARLSATTATDQSVVPVEASNTATASATATASNGAVAFSRPASGTSSAPFDLGFPRDLADKYELGDVLGSGGSGVVRVATDKRTGKRYACKTIPKVRMLGGGRWGRAMRRWASTAATRRRRWRRGAARNARRRGRDTTLTRAAPAPGRAS